MGWGGGERGRKRKLRFILASRRGEYVTTRTACSLTPFSQKWWLTQVAESFLLQTLFWLLPGAFGHHCLLPFVPSGYLPFSQSFYHALSPFALVPCPPVLPAALPFFFIFVKALGALPPPLPASSCPLARTPPGKQKSACQVLPALSHSLPNTYCCKKVAPALLPTPKLSAVRAASVLRWMLRKQS